MMIEERLFSKTERDPSSNFNFLHVHREYRARTVVTE